MNKSRNFLIFLLSPISLFFVIAGSSLNKWNAIFVILICGFLGYSFHINPNSDLDASRYISVFDDFCNGGNGVEIISFFNKLWQDSDNLELTSKLISYLASFISSDYHVLFSLMGLLYGYFLVLNIFQFKWYSNTNFLSKNYTIILLLILPPWLINGFDFWMATQIFIAGLFALLRKNYLMSIFFFSFASVTHWSFLVFILTFLLFSLMRNKSFLIFLFISSFIIKYFIGSEIIENVLNKLELVNILLKAQTYLDDSVTLPGGKIYGFILFCHRLLSYVLFFFLFINYKSEDNLKVKRLLNATVIIIVISNLISVIPILDRFNSIATYLIQFNFALIFSNYFDVGLNNIKRRIFIKALVINTTLFVIFIDLFYNGFLVIGVLSILSNPLIVYFIKDLDFVFGNVYSYLLNLLGFL